jgi:O-antigen ligase
MSATRSPAQGEISTTRPAAPWPTSWVVAAGTAGVLLLCLVTALFGPTIAVLIVVVVLGALAVLRFPIVALALPVVVAPVGLRAIPGAGGMQVIHIAVLAALGGLAVAFANGSVRFRPPAAMGFGLLFVAAMFASTIFSETPLVSLRVSVNHMLGAFLAVAVAVVVRGSRESMLWVMRGWILAGILLIVPALPSALLASEVFGGSLVQGRVQGAFSQPNDYGEFCLLTAVVAGALLAGRHPAWDRWLGFAGLFAGVAGGAVSFSRGTWLGAAGCLFAVAVLSPQLRRRVFGLVVGLLAFLLLGAWVGQAPFPTLVSRLLGIFIGATNPEDDRPLIYEQGIRIFRENHVFGVGPGGYLSASQEAGSPLIRHTYIHSHNILLTVAAEVGIVGVIALLSFTAALAVATLTARKRLLAVGDTSENATLAILAGGLVGIAVHGLIDVVYTNPLLIPLAWFLAGLVAGLTAQIMDRIPDDPRHVAVSPS